MLHHATAFSSFSVDDLEKAKHFYRDVLAIQVEENPMGLLALKLANGVDVMLYPKDDHVPATFTVLNFYVHYLDKVVDEMKAKAVQFEHYFLPGLQTDDKGIMRGTPNIAWFKDPAGNILSLIEQKDADT